MMGHPTPVPVLQKLNSGLAPGMARSQIVSRVGMSDFRSDGASTIQIWWDESQEQLSPAETSVSTVRVYGRG
jgi:hypothetical protein